MKLKAGEERQARRAIEEAKRNIDLPEGVSFSEMKSSFDNSDKENGTFIVIMSIVFIYMLIAFLFESFLDMFLLIRSNSLAYEDYQFHLFGVSGNTNYQNRAPGRRCGTWRNK